MASGSVFSKNRVAVSFSCQLCNPYLLLFGESESLVMLLTERQWAVCPWAPFCWSQRGQAAVPCGPSWNAEARTQAALCSRLSLQKGCTATFSSSQKSPRVLAALALPSPDLTRPLCPEMGKGGLKHKREILSLKSYLKEKLTCRVIGSCKSNLLWWAQSGGRVVCEIFHLRKEAI